MDRPLVSVGFPVYNGETTMRRAIDGLLAQDYPNLELVIADNASTDGTREICEEYARRDPRVRVQRNDTNIGPVENFKLVTRLARGEYFMWAARDDAWSPGFVGALVREFEAHPDASVAMSALDRVYDDGELQDTVRFRGPANPNDRSERELIGMLLTPVKYNFFVYGLFPTALIQKICAAVPGLAAWDRCVMLTAAFAGPFRYVDEVLHQRTVYRAARPPQLKVGLAAELEVAPTLARILLRADFIPVRNKALIPWMVVRHMGWRVVPRLRKGGSRWLRSRLGLSS